MIYTNPESPFEDQTILFDHVARTAVMRGVDRVAKAVKATLGPKGRNAVLDLPFGQVPRVTKDGVTVARHAPKCACRFEYVGMRLIADAAEKQNSECGDGTTTVTVLTQAIASQGMKAVAAGLNPMDLKRGIDAAVAQATKALRDQTIPIESDADLRSIALVSSNGDERVADKIHEATQAVGGGGTILVEQSRGYDIELEIVPGMMIDSGILYPDFLTNPASVTCELTDPLIFIYDGKLNRLQDINAFLESAFSSRRDLLIMAESFENQILQTLALNKRETGWNVCPIQLPGFGQMKDDLLEDLSVLTATPIISRKSAHELSRMTADMCGTAKKVVVGRKTTTFAGGSGDPEQIAQRVQTIKAQLEQAQDDSEAKNFDVRIASLTTGIAVIKAGGITETEARERKDRIDDAVHAVRAAASGGIVAGGGAALFHASRNVVSQGHGESTEYAMGFDIVVRAMEEPLRALAENAGREGARVIARIESQGRNSHPSYCCFGWNAQTDAYEDLVESGVIDPAKVVISALRNAASMAGMLITTQVVTSPLREKERNA